MFLIGGYNSGNIKFVEEYDYDQNIWTTKGPAFLQARHHTRAVSVPASWFAHLPGGCSGVK